MGPERHTHTHTGPRPAGHYQHEASVPRPCPRASPASPHPPHFFHKRTKHLDLTGQGGKKYQNKQNTRPASSSAHGFSSPALQSGRAAK